MIGRRWIVPNFPPDSYISGISYIHGRAYSVVSPHCTQTGRWCNQDVPWHQNTRNSGQGENPTCSPVSGIFHTRFLEPFHTRYSQAWSQDWCSNHNHFRIATYCMALSSLPLPERVAEVLPRVCPWYQPDYHPWAYRVWVFRQMSPACVCTDYRRLNCSGDGQSKAQSSFK